MEHKVLFIDINEELPSYVENYKGWYVTKDSRLYFGTDDGWQELTNTGVEPIIISFPSDKLENADYQIGQQGETFYMIDVENDESNIFYKTIGAETTDTKDTYFAKLHKSPVLMYGNVPNYIPVSYIEDTETNKITLTWHTHFWSERDDEKMSNTLADCMCVIDFKNLIVSFAMSQYRDDEAHMALPYKVAIDINVVKNDSNETITTISLKDINGESLTCSDILSWCKKGYKIVFGTLNSDGSFVAADQDYDIWFYSDSQLALRYPEIRRKSINGTYYYTNMYSVTVFDEDGTIQSNDTTDTYIKGYSYTWSPIQDAEGDSYINVSITKSDVYKNLLKLSAITHDIDTATETTNGLATALNTKNYVDTSISNIDGNDVKLGNVTPYDSEYTVLSKDNTITDTFVNLEKEIIDNEETVANALNEIKGKVVTDEMVSTLWEVLKICTYNTTDTTDIINSFKSAWNITDDE